MSFRLLPISPARVAAVTAIAALIAVAFCYLLARYYAFFHLGVGGGFVFVVFIPVAILLSISLGLITTFVLLTRQVPARRATRIAVAGLLVVAVAGFAAEVHRTAESRSGEGEGAGDLAPFYRSLVGLR